MVWPEKYIKYPEPIHPPYKFIDPTAIQKPDEDEALTIKFPPFFVPEILPKRLTGSRFVQWNTQSRDGSHNFMMNVLTPHGWEMPQQLLDELGPGVPNALVYQIHAAGLIVQKTAQLFEGLNRRFEATFVSDNWPEYSTDDSKSNFMPRLAIPNLIKYKNPCDVRRDVPEPPKGQFSRPKSVSQPILKSLSQSASNPAPLPNPLPFLRPMLQLNTQLDSKPPFKSIWTTMRASSDSTGSKPSEASTQINKPLPEQNIEKRPSEELPNTSSEHAVGRPSAEVDRGRRPIPSARSTSIAPKAPSESTAAKQPRKASSDTAAIRNVEVLPSLPERCSERPETHRPSKSTLKSKRAPNALSSKRLRAEPSDFASDFGEDKKPIQLQLRPSARKYREYFYSLNQDFMKDCRFWRLKTAELEPEVIEGWDAEQCDRYAEWYEDTFANLYRWTEQYESTGFNLLEELRKNMARPVEIVEVHEKNDEEDDQASRAGTKRKGKERAVAETKLLYRIGGGRTIEVNRPTLGGEPQLPRARAVSQPMPDWRSRGPQETPTKWWALKIKHEKKDPNRPWTDWT